MDEIDRIFVALKTDIANGSPIIACLYTGLVLPSYCEPMPRRPEPAIGMEFDTNFSEVITTALVTNFAVHDGAILIGRRTSSDTYRMVGWSYRMFPPPGPVEVEPNRGSAFNSCLAMSHVETIDCAYVVSAEGVFKFKQGSVSILSQRSIVRLPS